MMDALGVARDLGADHAGRVGVVLGAAHAADGAVVEHLDLERAGRGQSCGQAEADADRGGRTV